MFLKIDKFHMVKNSTIQLNGLTVIAGENNTGKSTVGKVLFSLIKASNIKTTPMKPFSLVFDDAPLTNSKVSIVQGQTGKFTLEIEHDGSTFFGGSFDPEQLSDAIYLESPVVWSLVDFFTTVGKLKEHSGMYGIADEVDYPYLLWDTYRKLVLKNSNPPQETQSEQYKQIISNMSHTVGGTISKKLEKFQFVRTQDNASFPVTTIATGMKSFGTLQVLAENNWIHPQSILIIDEPEVHLHPKWEVDFAKVIAQFVKLGVRVLVTTHSLYMVKALREFTKETPDKASFYLAEQTDPTSTQIIDVTHETHKIFKKFADPLQNIVWGK